MKSVFAFKYTILIGCFFLLKINGYSQHYTFNDTYPENNTDSLENWLSKNPTINEARMMNIIKLERSYMWKVSPKSFNYIDELGIVSKKIHHSGGLVYWKFMRGLILNANSRNDEAENLINDALSDSFIKTDLSVQINVYSYLSILYLSKNKNSKLPLIYLEKAKTLLLKSTDIHDKIIVLIAELNEQNYGVNRNDNKLFSIINQILLLYNSNPTKLSYCKYWVKLMEADFYKTLRNHIKENAILKDLAKNVNTDNLYMLTRVQLALGDSYVSLKKFDNAIIEYKKGITYFHQVPQFKVQPLVDNSNFQILLTLFHNYRTLSITLNDFKTSNALADSIFEYQKLDLDEKNRKAILEMQYRYNFEKSESEVKKLAAEKQLSQILQKGLKYSILLEKEKVNILKYKQKNEYAKGQLLLSKAKIENQVMLLRTKRIEDDKNRLANYIVLGTIAFIILIGFLMILRFYYLREKKITRFRDKFYTVLAHDLRGSINSLTDMGGMMSHLIRNNMVSDMQIVANQLDWLGCHSSLLLDNLFDWGTSNNFGIDTTPQKIDIPIFINNIIESYLPAIKTKDIEVVFTAPAHLEISTSPKCIDVIIRNLISNAKTYTPLGGKIYITIEAIKSSQEVLISVKDTGKGIPVDRINFIQKVFNGKIKPEVGENGLGLGVILMSYFAEKNNSSLELTSKVDVGTCVSLILNDD